MRDRHEVEPSGPRRFVPAHCRARSGPGRSMPRRGTKSLRRATRQVFAGLKSWPRLRLESGTLILRLLWLTPSYQAQILPSASCAECSWAFRVEALANGQASSRSGALGTTTGFSTCPHRRHSRRASIFTMFMPHFGHGGRTSKQVNGCSLSGGSFARSSASLIDRLEVVDSDCHQGARRNGALRYPLFYIFIIALRCPESRRGLSVK
jgi:hypothetical protein